MKKIIFTFSLFVVLFSNFSCSEKDNNTIDIDESIPEGSSLYKKVKNHEEQHVKDMSEGKLGYTDDNITYMGKTYPRKNGKIKYNGKWTAEGDHSFPWEKRAQKAE